MEMKKNITVTQLVDFHRCEKLAILKLNKKEVVSRSRQNAIDNGVILHQRLEKQVLVDGRCFVASYAFGPDAVETIFLREYRDSVLMGNRIGRGFVMIYYKFSPMAVKCFSNFKYGKRVARGIVKGILKVIQCSKRY